MKKIFFICFVLAGFAFAVGVAERDLVQVRMSHLSELRFRAGEVARGRRHDGEAQIQCESGDCSSIVDVICSNGRLYSIMHVHGKWYCSSVTDTEKLVPIEAKVKCESWDNRTD